MLSCLGRLAKSSSPSHEHGSGRKARLRVSAMKSWLPCTYWKVTTYLCNLIISAWILQDAWLSSFFKMVASGLWSFWICTSRPYVYSSKRSSPNTSDSVSFSVCAHFCSAWVSALDANSACHPEELLPQDRLCCCLLAALVLSLG